jgi:hypothetical protein
MPGSLGGGSERFSAQRFIHNLQGVQCRTFTQVVA